MERLPLDELRRLASNAGLREIQFNEESRVVAFISDDGTRFNIYYTTGTVGTYLLHPRQGKTQLFRRNVSLSLLKEIFRTPRIHTDFGYHRHHSGVESQRKRARTMSGDWDAGTAGDVASIDGEERAAKKQLEKLLAEEEALKDEIKEVKSIIEDHERRREEKRKKEDAERQRQEEERRREEAIAQENILKEMKRKRGVCGTWVLKETDDFEKNFTEDTCCVAVGSDGAHICLYDSGAWAYSSGLYTNLHKILHTRALSHPSPEYVAMGSMDRYYIKFANGKSQWVGPNNLSDLLQNDNRKVKSVAFGENFEDYFVVFEGGGYQYVGCPSDLENKIQARESRGDLEKVTFGPNGE